MYLHVSACVAQFRWFRCYFLTWIIFNVFFFFFFGHKLTVGIKIFRGSPVQFPAPESQNFRTTVWSPVDQQREDLMVATHAATGCAPIATDMLSTKTMKTCTNIRSTVQIIDYMLFHAWSEFGSEVPGRHPATWYHNPPKWVFFWLDWAPHWFDASPTGRSEGVYTCWENHHFFLTSWILPWAVGQLRPRHLSARKKSPHIPDIWQLNTRFTDS